MEESLFFVILRFTYWLKTGNVHYALQQNTESPHSLPKHKLQVSVVKIKQEII